MAGIELANWNWGVVHQFVLERFGIGLSRSSCLNYLHRLGFTFNRPKKHLLKADGAKREAFVAEYAALTEEARRSGARIFFADEAHFRADAELRGKWVLRGEPAPVDSTSPRYGEKVSRASTKHTSGAEQKCTTREVIGQRKCPRQLFGRGVTEAGWQQAGRVSE